MTMWCGWRGPLVDIDRPGFVAMATSGSDETAKLTFEEISKLQERKVRRWARARGGGFGGKHSTHTRSVMRPFRRCVLFGVWRVFESACPCVYECMLSASACAVCGQCSACVTRCVVFALASAAFLQCSGVCVCVFVCVCVQCPFCPHLVLLGACACVAWPSPFAACGHWRQAELKAAHTEYLAAHPELKTILNDFMAAVLTDKPDDIVDFARGHFTLYKK